MRLTQIKLAGFKSFTDPTTIHLPSQLVAVIGPNGCGKSNVIDAVRWVLGESSAKQLRGESMQDVIFNGAATRRPAPRASVELVFDNSDHRLPSAWGKYAEISIKRQLTRQGESAYFINQQHVRRRDITDLFLGTGVGARGYAVIEQGMIARIIEARPEELRAYLEEAAGVSKYKERRRETESRLKDTREHLQQLAHIQHEISQQIQKLSDQASTAERYHDWQGQLNHAQNLLNYVQWQKALNQADTAKIHHENAIHAQEEAQIQYQSILEQLTQIRTKEQEYQGKYQTLNQEYALIREQIIRLEEQLRARKTQQQRMERERAHAQQQLYAITQEQARIHTECGAIEKTIEQKNQTLSEWAITLAEHEHRLPEAEQQQSEWQSALHHQQDQLNRIKRERALLQQRMQHAQQQIDALNTRQQRLIAEQNALALPDPETLHHAQHSANTLQEQYEAIEETLLSSEHIVQHSRAAQQHAQTQMHAAQQQLFSTQAEHNALTQILQHAPDTDFWRDTEYANTPIMWQQLRIDPAWQHALSVILAERLYTRMLPEDSRLSEPLPQGSAVWIHHSATESTAKLPDERALIRHIQAEPIFQAALNAWLHGAWCAPDLAYAVQHQTELPPQYFWITPEGHRVDKHSVWLYGDTQGDSWLQHKTRLAQLDTQLAADSAAFERAQQEYETLNAQWIQAQQTFQAQTQQQKHMAQAWQKAQQHAHECLTRTQQGQLRHEHIRQELAQIDEELQYAKQQAHAASADSETLSAAIEDLESQCSQLSGSLKTAQQQLQQARLGQLEANRQYGSVEIELHKCQQQWQYLQQQIVDLEQQKLNWQTRQSELAFNPEPDVDDEQYARLEAFNERVLDLDERMIAAQEMLQSAQSQAQQLFDAQNQYHHKLPEYQNAIQQALLQQQEALLTAKRHHDQLLAQAADLNVLSTESAQTTHNAHSLNTLIHQLENQIESLGAVNLAALDELRQTQERDDYYRQQSQDVQNAIDLLETAIAQIDEETKTRFQATFDAVNAKMRTIFPTLFGGGEAALHMVGDDLLSAGVSIMAQPPGKKNATIHLLSGGEKSLTAISLVFALFSLNPAPFCLLDEVDAPLDDANVARFCQLVKEMSAQTQFLYISHNRLTMEMADQLIGVTMQEKGVSRIVSVDLQDVLQNHAG